MIAVGAEALAAANATTGYPGGFTAYSQGIAQSTTLTKCLQDFKYQSSQQVCFLEVIVHLCWNPTCSRQGRTF